MNIPRHYQQLPQTAFIQPTDRCYDEVDHEWYQCPVSKQNKPVGAEIVIRREPAGAVNCYDGDEGYFEGLPF